jgi:hypothetical protein
VSPFWRHFLEMFAAMVVGMIATGAIFIAVVGLKTWDEVTTQYATQSLLAMAAGMTLPMVAWMLYRGMGWKNAVEDGRGHDPPRDPLPVPRLVRRHQERPMRGVLCRDRAGDARAHGLPPPRVLDGDVASWAGMSATVLALVASQPALLVY